MVSLLKKLPKTGAPAQRTAPAWLPDFRRVELLPDVSVVRSKFLITVCFVAAASAATVYLGYREFSNYKLRGAIARAEGEIASLAPKHKAALAEFAAYQQADAALRESASFLDQPFSLVILYGLFARTLQPEVTLGVIRFEGQRVDIEGTVPGLDAQANDRAVAYLNGLRDHPDVKAIFPAFRIVEIARRNELSATQFRATLELPPPPRPTKAR